MHEIKYVAAPYVKSSELLTGKNGVVFGTFTGLRII